MTLLFADIDGRVSVAADDVLLTKGSLWRVPKATGAPSVVATAAALGGTQFHRAWADVANDRLVYVLDRGASPDEVGVMSTDGATVTPLAQVTRYGDSTFDGDSVYLLGALVGAAAVVHPIRVPLDGSAPVELAGTPTTTAGIAVDGTTVYTCTSALLQRTPKGGGAATTLPTGCESILVDATNIYFSVGRRVFRQAKSSAFAPQLFTDGPACATDVRSARLELVAQNDTKVFFSVGERASESPAACPPHFLGMRAK